MHFICGRVQDRVEDVGEGLGGSGFALPDGGYAPARFLQGFGFLGVAGYRPGSLGGPELGSCDGDHFAVTAVVGVPEAAVDEDCEAVLREDDVRFAGQVLLVEAEAVAEGV